MRNSRVSQQNNNDTVLMGGRHSKDNNIRLFGKNVEVIKIGKHKYVQLPLKFAIKCSEKHTNKQGGNR